MRRLVRDDVVRETGVDALAAGTREVTEEYRAVVPGIERVRVGKGVRGHVQLVPVRCPRERVGQARIRIVPACA